jgi:hypothetical protein
MLPIPIDTPETRKEKVLWSVARVMGQLRFFHASKVGKLHFESLNGQNLGELDVKSFYSVHLDKSLYDNRCNTTPTKKQIT